MPGGGRRSPGASRRRLNLEGSEFVAGISPHPNPAVPREARGASRPALPLALALQVAARPPPLRDPGLPLAGLLRSLRRRLRQGAVHRALPARDLRLQRRRPAVDVARLLLLLRRERHRPLSAVHARGRARLSGPARDRVSGLAAEGLQAARLVARRDSAVHRRRGLPRHRCRVRVDRRVAGQPRPDLHPRLRLGARAALPRCVPTLDLRLRARARPLGPARERVCRRDDAGVPAVPRRPRRGGARRAHARPGRGADPRRRSARAGTQVGPGPRPRGRARQPGAAARARRARDRRYGDRPRPDAARCGVT